MVTAVTAQPMPAMSQIFPAFFSLICSLFSEELLLFVRFKLSPLFGIELLLSFPVFHFDSVEFGIVIILSVFELAKGEHTNKQRTIKTDILIIVPNPHNGWLYGFSYFS
jgi:hypothetical protein